MLVWNWGNGCSRCSKIGHSQKSIQWLTQSSKEQPINIQHADNGGEFRIPGTKWKADGHCAETNTIYEFHRDTFHGNPSIYKNEDRCHPFNRTVTAGQTYQQTLLREEKIRSLICNLVVMSELELGNTQPKLNKFAST